MNYLGDEKFNPKSSVCYIKACNDLAVIHSEREQSEKSLETLNIAKKIYSEVIDRDENPGLGFFGTHRLAFVGSPESPEPSPGAW